MERDSTTSTREALEHGARRRSRLRTGVVIAGVSALVLGIAAGVGWFLVPPWLATVPGDPIASATTIVVTADEPTDGSTGAAAGSSAPASASVEVSAGWTPIGVGPFLPTDSAVLVSPDGAYRAHLEITDAGADSDATPGDSTDHLDGLATAAWNRESLDSGCSVRYTTVQDGEEAVTVAVVSPPPGAPGDADARLVLTGSVSADAADLYRTVTADLVTSARFGNPDADAVGPTPASPSGPSSPSPSTDGSAP
ncbi:hypothetical protein DVJ78_17795 [Humibacter sp. BT305]|nr:hypothetical protein DVJ78_17795 [Humibacter sp. BT305]